MTSVVGCPLCNSVGGVLVATGAKWRVIRAEDDQFPAFYRVIWSEHVAEFSSLLPRDRADCIDVVCAIEQTLIRVLQPTKINLAALGNMVPHLHWHVIARFDGDSHFPQTIWGAAQRQVEAPSRLLRVPLSELDRQMGLALQALASRA